MRAASGLNFLWIIDFDYSTRAHHGGSVRYFNFAPELLAQGHTVTFVVRFNEADKEPSRAWFEAQKQAGVFTDYVEVDWQIPRWRSRLATAVVYPGWAARILRPVYREAMARIKALLVERKASVLLVSARRFFFVIAERENYPQPMLLDAGDSFGLYTARQARYFLRARAWKSLLGTVRPMVEEFLTGALLWATFHFECGGIAGGQAGLRTDHGPSRQDRCAPERRADARPSASHPETT